MIWKQQLIDKFIPELEPKVWAVFDPDGIVRNEQILGALQQKGFDSVYFEDPIAFRYEFESRIRRVWERGESTPLAVIFDETAGDTFDGLPSDILISAHRLEFGLDDLFPNLDAGVMRGLEPEMWTVVSAQAAKHPGKKFRASETEELVMKVCFRLVPELIDTPVELIRRLIDLHRSGRKLSEPLSVRLGNELSRQPSLIDWPVARLAADPKAFWQFLQERWQYYVAGKRGGSEFQEAKMMIAGPRDLPFDDPALRMFIDTLFVDGLLERVPVRVAAGANAEWWAVGVHFPEENRTPLITVDQVTKLIGEVPGPGDSHKEWIRFGLAYSKVTGGIFRTGEASIMAAFWATLWPTVDQRFSEWLESGYASLHNLPSSPPPMIHHAPRQMARWIKDGSKVALIVLDGLSLAGWFTIRQALLTNFSEKIVIDESATFSWLPTLTPICRQALFAGLAPPFFPETIQRTNCDERRWKEFWTTHANLFPKQIHHQLMKGEWEELEDLPDFSTNQIQACGITLSQPDEIMHGATLGWAGWHQQLDLWMRSGFLVRLLEQLLDNGFTVCLSADHGNLESIGSGRINEGVLAERRGQRVRFYPNETLRTRAIADIGPDAKTIAVDLGTNDFFPLFATGRGAFVSKGERIVAHGGASLDEVLVPWITARRATG